MQEKLHNFFVKHFNVKTLLILYSIFTTIFFMILYTKATLFRDTFTLFLFSILFASILIFFIAIIAKILDI